MITLNKTEQIRRPSMYLLWKGILDRMVALLLTIALSSVMALIAILICIDSPGWPIFTQERVGGNGRRFKIRKFRTMINADDRHYKDYLRKLIVEGLPYKVDQQGRAIYKIIDDPRITRFGAFLRKTSLDELPQIINVLNGDMSLVGPRPDIPFAVDMYDEWHRKRLSVKSGMTGLWQVSGANQVPFDEMVRLDIEYITRRSFTLDIEILLRTIGLVLLRRNGELRGKEAKDSG